MLYPYYSQNTSQNFMSNRPMNYMDNYNQMQSQQFLGLRGRPVASIDEAKASIIDFDGTVFYFPDVANQKIYSKQINLDGTSSLKVYEQVMYQPQQPLSNEGTQKIELPENLVTKEEFNSTIQNLTNEIQSLKGAESKNESSTNDSGTYKF